VPGARFIISYDGEPLHTHFQHNARQCASEIAQIETTSFAKDIAMSTLFAAIAVAAVLTSSALAQSTDTSVGSGNTAQRPVEDGALSASAFHELQLRNDLMGRTVLPHTLQEHRAFERAKGNIW
jgi:hypothetical protein